MMETDKKKCSHFQKQSDKIEEKKKKKIRMTRQEKEAYKNEKTEDKKEKDNCMCNAHVFFLRVILEILNNDIKLI